MAFCFFPPPLLASFLPFWLFLVSSSSSELPPSLLDSDSMNSLLLNPPPEPAEVKLTAEPDFSTLDEDFTFLLSPPALLALLAALASFLAALMASAPPDSIHFLYSTSYFFLFSAALSSHSDLSVIAFHNSPAFLPNSAILSPG